MSKLLNIEEIKKKIEEISIDEIKEIEEITEEFNTKIAKIKEKATQKRNDLKEEIEKEIKKIENMFPSLNGTILGTLDNSTYYPNSTSTTTTKPKPTRSGSVVR